MYMLQCYYSYVHRRGKTSLASSIHVIAMVFINIDPPIQGPRDVYVTMLLELYIHRRGKTSLASSAHVIAVGYCCRLFFSFFIFLVGLMTYPLGIGY